MDRTQMTYYYREKHPDIFMKVRQIINEIDPKGLIDLCGPEEYDIEVEDIITKFKDCNSENEVKQMVINVFTCWFDNPGNLDMYLDIGPKLFEIKRLMTNE